MKKGAAQVRGFAQERIADDIKICIAGQSETCAERGSASLFDIDEEFGGVVGAHSGVERQHAGGSFLVVRAQTVLAAVVGREWRMGLENEIRRTGEPEAGVLEVRKYGLGGFDGRIGGVVCVGLSLS